MQAMATLPALANVGAGVPQDARVCNGEGYHRRVPSRVEVRAHPPRGLRGKFELVPGPVEPAPGPPGAFFGNGARHRLIPLAPTATRNPYKEMPVKRRLSFGSLGTKDNFTMVCGHVSRETCAPQPSAVGGCIICDCAPWTKRRACVDARRLNPECRKVPSEDDPRRVPAQSRRKNRPSPAMLRSRSLRPGSTPSARPAERRATRA